MEKITLEYLESNFENIMDRCEQGQSFHIMTPDGKDVVLVPQSEVLAPLISQGIVHPYELEQSANHDDGDDYDWSMYTDHMEGT